MNFQDNLIRLREAVSPSAKSFAKQIGLAYTTYNNYEKGSWPNEENLKIIASALHVSTDELLGYSSPEEHTRCIKKAETYGLIIREHNGLIDIDINDDAIMKIEEAESAIVAELHKKKKLPLKDIPYSEFDHAVQVSEQRLLKNSKVQIIEDILFRLAME